MKDDESMVNVIMPTALRERARKVGKILKISTTQMIRDALDERVRFLENKIAEDKERAAEIKAPGKRSKKGFEPLTPKFETLTDTISTRKAVEPAAPPPAKEPDYSEYADHIYEAIAAGHSMETRLRVAEAIAAIKRKNPLTHPPEHKITSELERLVLIRRENAKLRQVQTEEVIIDTSKVKTLGDV